MKVISRASLQDIRAMKENGKLHHNPEAPTDIEILDTEFWAEARLHPAKTAARSVHLKLEPEVFAFFQSQGKGHLTKMQNVLRAYVAAQSRK